MNNLKDYILAIKTASEQESTKGFIKLLAEYKHNLDDVRNQIARIYARYTVDGELKIGNQQRFHELNALERQIVAQMRELGDSSVTATEHILSKVYTEAYYHSAFAIDSGTGAFQTFAPLKPEFVRAAVYAPIEGKDFSVRIWENTGTLAKRVQAHVKKALLQGRSVEKLAREIKAEFGSTAYQAKRLINTETAKAVTAAQIEAYQNSGVVARVMWDATLEGNTCPHCAELDGQYYELGNSPLVPLHPNCRCCLIPAVDGWKPSRKLENIVDSLTGEKQVIDYSSYSAWKSSRGI